jgi:very-short-patch-repair endonuclease
MTKDLTGCVFRGSYARRLGLLTTGQLRSKRWQRLGYDLYADARVPADHELRIAAARLVMPADGVFFGLSTAWLHGARLAAPAEPAHVAVPPTSSFGPYRGLRIHREQVPLEDVIALSGRRVTTADRTAADLARTLPPIEAVCAVDAMLHERVVSLAAVHARLARMADQPARPRGLRRAGSALALCDGRAESPLESRGRVLLVLAGMPPQVQYQVSAGGTFVGRVDLAYPECRLAIEIDGAWHASGRQLTKDHRRLNRLVAAGWTVLHFTAADLYLRPDEVVGSVRAQLARLAPLASA